MLNALTIPGLFVIGAAGGSGATYVAGAIADWFRRQRSRVGVCVPVATGVKRRREGLVSEEAEFLARHADARHPLDLICPQRFAEALPPAVAARRAGRELDWDAIARSLRIMSSDSDVMLVVGPTDGLMAPLDQKYLAIDLPGMLKIPALIVTQPGRAAINQTLLTASALKARSVKSVGVVVNRYPTDTPSIEIETSVREIEKWSGAPLLCIVPNEPAPAGILSPGAIAAIDQVDWWGKLRAAS